MTTVGTRQKESDRSRATGLSSSLVILLAGSLLVGFSMGRWSAPLLAWIGPVLILRYARDHKVGRGFLMVFAANVLALLIGFLSIWWGGVLRILIPVLALLIGLLWSLPYLADRLLSPRLPGFSSTLVYPLAAVTLELFYVRTSPLGSWGATGFSQYGNLALMQIASVTGMVGITFLMGWFAAAANWTWDNRQQPARLWRGLTMFGLVMGAVLLFGFVRLNSTIWNENQQTIRVAGITAQGLTTLFEQTAEVSSITEGKPILQAHIDRYFEDTAREAQAGAQLIIWPEVSAPTFEDEQESLLKRAQETAREYGIYLALPLLVMDSQTGQWQQNKLVLIGPDGQALFEHFKYGGNLFEGTFPGDGVLQAAETPFGTISGVICWDMDFPATIQQAGSNGTGLMLVPSRDWQAIDPVHTHMAVFRAIENGMSLVRQTDDGLSIAVDPYGRVLSQTDYFSSTNPTMIAQVPVQNVRTLYALGGRWFEWFCLAGLIFIIVWTVRISRKNG